MSTQTFALGRFRANGAPFVGIVIGDRVVALSDAGDVPQADTIDALLENWDDAFARLDKAVGELDGTAKSVSVDALAILPPISRPTRILCAAANYRDHVAGMRKNFTNNLPKVDDNSRFPRSSPISLSRRAPSAAPTMISCCRRT